MDFITPPAMSAGDRVAIVAPSSGGAHYARSSASNRLYSRLHDKATNSSLKLPERGQRISMQHSKIRRFEAFLQPSAGGISCESCLTLTLRWLGSIRRDFSE